MGPLTYYLPFIFGLLLPFGCHQTYMDQPRVMQMDPWQQWMVIAGFGLAYAIIFQALMIGSQGAFAQVLPVPFGKSVRGRGAVVCGATLIGAVICASAGAFLYYEDATTPALVTLAIAAGFGVVSLVAYVWAWPMAVRDFAAR